MVFREESERVPRLLGDAGWRTTPDVVPENGTSIHPDLLGRLMRISYAFSSGTPFDGMLHEITVAASQALDSEIILIRQVATDDVNFLVQAALGPAPLSTSGLVGVYSTVTDRVRTMSVGDSVTINLLEEKVHPLLSASEIWSFQQLGAQHALLIPLFASGVLVGRLDVVRTRNVLFEPDVSALAQLIATFAAQALHSHRLEHLAEESQVFQTVLGLHQSIEHLADPRTILQAVVELVVREPGAARCYAMLWDSERNEFVPTAVAGLEPHMVDMLKLISLSPQVAPAFDQMMHSSRPLVVADATKSTLLPQSLVRALGIRAAMIVPLRGRHQQTIGFLLVDQNREGAHFNEHQVTIMAGMARHLSAMIENAILYDRAVSSSESLSVINEIGIQLAMLTDEASLVRQLHYQVSSVVDASYFALALLTDDQTSMELWEACDGQLIANPVTTPVGDDQLSRVILTGRPSISGARTNDESSTWPTRDDDDTSFHSRLTAPITVGRSVIGALSIHSPYRHAYGPKELELLSAIALHTGVAIENARLYRLVQTRGDRRAAVLDAVINRHEVERKELVDDIHENTLQALAACLFRLDRAQISVEQDSAQEDVVRTLEDVRDELSSSIDQLRKRIFALRPATLDVLGLEPAVREYLKSIEQDLGLSARLEASLPHRLTPDHETVVYRIVQEAVTQIGETDTGVVVHIAGEAGEVNIVLKPEGDEIETDDSVVETSPDVALLALIERTELAGGELHTSTDVNGHQTIRIRVPATLRLNGVSTMSASADDQDRKREESAHEPVTV